MQLNIHMDYSFLIRNSCQYDSVLLFVEAMTTCFSHSIFLECFNKDRDLIGRDNNDQQNQTKAYILWPLDSAASDLRLSLHRIAEEMFSFLVFKIN